MNVVVQNSQEILPSLSDTTSPMATIGFSRGADRTRDKSVDHSFLGHQVRAVCCFKSSDYWIDNQSPVEFGSVVSPVMGHTYWPTGEEPGSFEKGDRLVVVDSVDTKVWKVRQILLAALEYPQTGCSYVTLDMISNISYFDRFQFVTPV